MLRKDFSDLILLHTIALAEGEGTGTAYEYFVKSKLLRKWFSQIRLKHRRILIAGLPEKYGYSMDFVFFAQTLNAEVFVLDDRKERIEKFRNVFRELVAEGKIENLSLEILRVKDWNSPKIDVFFDIAVSCEVIQRLGTYEKVEYLNFLGSVADYVILFSPNSENALHAKISGLRTVDLNFLTELIEENSSFQILERGYVDSPPFPPGLSLGKGSRGLNSKKSVVLGLTIPLVFWATLERFQSSRILRRNAHITYVLSKRTTNKHLDSHNEPIGVKRLGHIVTLKQAMTDLKSKNGLISCYLD